MVPMPILVDRAGQEQQLDLLRVEIHLPEEQANKRTKITHITVL
jgi:hypothetical protein